MGIPGFTKALLALFPKAVLPIPPDAIEYFDHIYLDLNGLIHVVGRKAKSDDDLIRKIFRRLDKFFKTVIPVKSVFLALDGPASIAKLVTQRKRRQKSTEKRAKGGKDASGFDSVQVTPGTHFMAKLKNALAYWVCSRVQNDRKFSRVEFRFFAGDTPGEGEVKILGEIQERAARSPAAQLESHLIVGSDADLVLGGLAAMLRNVFVLSTDLGHTRTLVSAWRLEEYFHRAFPNQQHNELVRFDFVLISLLLGNDYLPKLRGASLARLWTQYRRLRLGPFANQQLLDPQARQCSFNAQFLAALLKPYESILPANRGGGRRGGRGPAVAPASASAPPAGAPMAPPAPSALPPPAFDGRKDPASPSTPAAAIVREDGNYDVNDLEAETHAALLLEDDDEDDEDEEELEEEDRNAPRYDVEKYLEGLLWCVQMYKRGHCPNYQYVYRRPLAPPAVCVTQRDWRVPVPLTIDCTPPHFPYVIALALVPSEGRAYLPAAFNRFMNSDSPVGKLLASRSGHIDLARIASAVSEIPLAEFSPQDQMTLFFGPPVLYRRRGAADVNHVDPPAYLPVPPSASYEPLRQPLVFLSLMLQSLRFDQLATVAFEAAYFGLAVRPWVPFLRAAMIRHQGSQQQGGQRGPRNNNNQQLRGNNQQPQQQSQPAAAAIASPAGGQPVLPSQVPALAPKQGRNPRPPRPDQRPFQQPRPPRNNNNSNNARGPRQAQTQPPPSAAPASADGSTSPPPPAAMPKFQPKQRQQQRPPRQQNKPAPKLQSQPPQEWPAPVQ